MLDGKTVYFLGKLAASNRKEATDLVRRYGGRVARKLTPEVRIVVVGEGDVLSRDWNLWNDQLDDATRDAFESGSLEIVAEAFFWDHYGSNSDDPEKTPSGSLYTPSMLAELTDLPISAIRRLQQQQLIVPLRQVHRLCYFDVESVLPLKIIRNLLDAGFSFSRAVDHLRRVKTYSAGVPANVRVQGKDVLFATEKGEIDQDGQRRFPFVFEPEIEARAPDESFDEPLEILDSVFEPGADPGDAAALCEAAWTLESEGKMGEAAELYRAALAAGGPNPLINFQIAEILYRLGDLSAARERYFMAVELDDEFVEARANLGCVLAELGSDELAAAAFRGALKYHPDYAEVHFHLGMLLRRVGLEEEANRHLGLFLELAPDSPWADRLSNEAGK